MPVILAMIGQSLDAPDLDYWQIEHQHLQGLPNHVA